MNEVGYFNKHISQMLVFNRYLFSGAHTNYRLLALISFVSLLSACTPSDINVERIPLGDWAINDARFSQTGSLALSVSQDIGIYNTNGELLHLLSLPEPNGIWQITWQDPHNLWLYDKYNLYHWQVDATDIAQPHSFQADAIRQVRATNNGLMLATESGSVYWFEITAENTLNSPRTLLENLSSIATLGFTMQQQPYVATKNGELWLWADSSYGTLDYFKVSQPIHEVITIDKELFALSSRYNNPLATGNELTLWRLATNKAPQPYKLDGSTGVFSYLVANNVLIIGGSNSSWQSFNVVTQKQTSGALKTRNPNQQGRIIALYDLPNVILMLSSRGELQKWQKTRIFENGQ